ncbi:MAG: OmpH family outer membrane protein [Dysgonamonadaceae bacterium]|nr:OmpH family outer membrane protein [Dysgonamonadaceae bacterium]MDD4728546.1 OmpH family outer membrane protein [Dysgonamonadaceae bacterium]
MKNNYVISGILAAALILLYILHFTSKTNNSGDQIKYEFAAGDSVALPIAYINVDSLLMNYNFAKDLNEALMRIEENSRASLTQKERQVQTAAQEFQRKLENNAFLTQQRAEEEQRRIQKMGDDYQRMAQQLGNELGLEQQKLNIQLSDSIRGALQDFNKNKNFEVILSNTASDNILLAHPKYDITDDVIVYLNKRYGPATATTESKK